jgi:hypothetical protein
MLLKPNEAFSAMSGKFFTMVTYMLRSRQISRAFVVPYNPATAMQTLIRNTLRTVSEAYSALTQDQATAWGLRGAQVTRHDALGRAYTLTGKALYTEINFYRMLVIGNQTATVPSVASVPAVVSAVLERVTSPNAGVTITATTTGSTTGMLAFRMSRPLPGTARRARKNDMRYNQNNNVALLFITVTGNTTTCHIPDTQMLFPLTAGERVGLLLTRLNPDYFASSDLLIPSAVIAV